MSNKTYAEMEGKFTAEGGWEANAGSLFRSLTQQELAELKEMALIKTPVFGGSNNAEWHEHHPVARDIFAACGLKPKDAK